MRLEFPCPLFDAPPTAVHTWCDRGLAGSMVKMRKLSDAWSAEVSPRPDCGTGLSKVSDQLESEPVRPETLSVICSVHVPAELCPSSALSGSCGLNLPKNGAPPFWIGVVAQ